MNRFLSKIVSPVLVGSVAIAVLSSGCGSSSPNTKMIELPGQVVLDLVRLPSGLWFGKCEVTQAQWEAIMGENPSKFRGAIHPVENVSMDDCREFLEKLNSLPAVKETGLVFRLPTGFEWEYACRAGAKGKYCQLADGTEITDETLSRVAWFSDNSDEKTHPVGQKEPNAFGLFDMHGNVLEWLSTDDCLKDGWYNTPANDTENVPVGTLIPNSPELYDDQGHSWTWISKPERLSCGGCWASSAADCEASSLLGEELSFPDDDLGFRLCASGEAD